MAVAIGMTQKPPLALADQPRRTARPGRSGHGGVTNHAQATTRIEKRPPSNGQTRSPQPSRRHAARIDTITETSTIWPRMITRHVLAIRVLREAIAPPAAPTA